ncbi:MAG: sulfotransferase [Proteobacteria bacterium]|nr:sulfotransferase [Pseudomonadota bacterium]
MRHDPNTSPNLFLVGAPKCGTTSLYEYLRAHPQIYFPHDAQHEPTDSSVGYWLCKEPAFFCTDLELPAHKSIKSERDYLALYAGGEGHKWRGDASAFYLYSRTAAERIRAFCPEARILITLRPPVDQMHSWHNDCLLGPTENITDFHEAIAASEDRRMGRRLAPQGIPAWQDYFGVSQFAGQVQRYMETFGRDAVHVVLLEDLSARPVETYRGILEFLDVDPSFIPEFRVYNEPPIHGSLERVLNAVHSLPGVRQVADFIFPYPVRRRLVKAVRSTESRHQAPPDPRDAELRQRCRPDIERLAALIDRDLSHWM